MQGALSTSAKQFRPGGKAYAELLKALNCTSCSFSFIQVHGRYALKLEQWKNQLFLSTSWSKKKTGSQIFKNPNCLNVAQPSSQGKFCLKGNKTCPNCMWLIHIDSRNFYLQHGENGSNRNSVLPVSFEASMKISWCIEPLARLASLATKVFDATLGPAPWEVEGPGVQHLQFVKSLWRACASSSLNIEGPGPCAVPSTGRWGIPVKLDEVWDFQPCLWCYKRSLRRWPCWQRTPGQCFTSSTGHDTSDPSFAFKMSFHTQARAMPGACQDH